MSKVSDLASVSEFLFWEARLLDEGRFEEWAQVFTEDGYYWAPIRPGQQSPLEEVSLFYDDRTSLAQRIERLRHPEVHFQQPASRTARLISNISITSRVGAEELLVTSKFVMFEFRPGWEQQYFAGTYEHRLQANGDSFKIKSKKATLINQDGYLPPLSMPF